MQPDLAGMKIAADQSSNLMHPFHFPVVMLILEESST
jgi:hypothetical protein